MSMPTPPAPPAPGSGSTESLRPARPGVVGWVAMVLGALFAAMFAVAWWDESQARRESAIGGDAGAASWFEQWAIGSHLLPAVLLLVAVILAWRWPLVAAVAFLGYSVASVFTWFPEWMYAPLVTVPPLAIGVLFLVEWVLRRRRLRPDAASRA